MATKFQLISEVYEREIKTVSTPARWQGFLTSACRNYKCRFDEQLLIFAQRPDATAVLEIEKWNSQFNRWVNKGANGIAVFDKNTQNKRLKYYFDVSDTHEGKYAKQVPIWQYQNTFQDDIIETLEGTFGELSEKDNLVDAIFSASENAAEDNLADYLSDLKQYVPDSFLEGTGEDYVSKTYKDLVKNSVAYMLLTRLGFDANEYLSADDFQGIADFNTKDTINSLGMATSDITEMGLREITSTVIALQKSDKNIIRTFVEQNNNQYNISINKNERSFDNEQSNLQQSGRLQPTQPNIATGTGSSPWEVRIGKTEISGTETQSDVGKSANLLQTERTPAGNRETSIRNDGTVSFSDGENSGSYGRNESDRPNEVGRNDEQYQELSDGNSDERADLLLNADLPTVEEQQNIIEESEVITTSDFSLLLSGFSQEEIDAVLTRGSGVQDGKYRIYEQFLKKQSMAENANMLKEEYGWGGAYPALDTEKYGKIDEGHDGKGIKISKGSIMEPTASITLNWNKVAQRISELVATNRYLNDKQTAYFPIYQQKELERNERWKVAKEFNSIISEYNQYVTDLGETGKTLNQYVLTDCGQCFAQAVKKTNNLSARGDFILPLMHGALETIIAENTPLTDRAKAMQIVLNGDMALSVMPEPEPEYAYEYHLGDTVYIGADSYEIVSFDNDIVKVFDDKFPLFNKEFKRADFDKKVEENPSNDHLRVIVEEKAEPIVSQESPYSQYLKIKEEYPLDIVTFEVGDFFEFYLEDAKIASDIIGLHLATRVIDGEYVSMCGIPHHKLEEYTQKILDEGHNVVVHGKDEVTGKITTSKIVSESKYDQPQMVDTNIGSMPIEDYREIQAMQNGFDSYEDMRNQGVRLGDEYDTEPNIQQEIVEENFDNEFSDDELASIYGGDTAQAQQEIVEEMQTQNSYDDLIGKELTIDNRKYLIEEVRSFSKDVSMRDITFENAVGFPINRLEKVDYVRRLLAEKEKENLVSNFDKKPTTRVKNYDLHPEIKQADRNQYSITNNDLGVGTAKEKFRANMAAINLLKELEFDNRFATHQEQEILAGYVGFGSLADAFDESKTAWANEFRELYATLSPEEYSAARESTLTAFYTQPIVIKAMYKALENMGLSKGNILEPSCGTGNFIGMLPDSMKESKVYGVELDSLTGRIAQQLYQKSSIAVQGYENTNLPDSFFDVAIGNVPFGQFKVADKKYDKQNWLIHDYFFGKTLDKVRPGGVVAFITSKGTLDKENPQVRKYIAQRADLLGAIRLPNNAFKANAGTEVTSDIIFLQKRDRIIDIEPDWVHLGTDENGLKMNQYFIDNPEMIMGEMKEISGPYGPETACIANDNQSLEDMLSDAIGNIHAEISEYEMDELAEEEDLSIPADPTVRNFSYANLDGTIYFRENSRMTPVDVSATAESRIKGMIEIRDCVRTLIEYQTEDYPDSDIKAEQDKLNSIYDKFTKKYGVLSSRANSMAFSDDSSYSLLSSLEVINENGNLERKADMFSKRTIKPHIAVTSVDTSSEALAVSLSEKARIDMEFMSKLTGKEESVIAEELSGVIFRVPTAMASNGERPVVYQTADEYLSGNVREKLAQAEIDAETDNLFEVNVTALKKVQPVDLTASEISVRLGATWLPPEDVQKFMFELLETPRYTQWGVKVHYSQFTSEWNIEGKSNDRSNIKAINTYGSSRINAYKVIEETLNLKDVRIFDYVEDAEGKRTAVLNKKETAIAQAKQELIKNVFNDWIWKDPNRRERLTRMYNDKFNSVRPREYDGSHISFSGINPEISLREHQVNAIAHIMYGGNTLLAHVVGAGKTFEIVAASQESKRLGLCNKSLIVVPNHLTEQWAAEWLQLYPSANILVATKKDFEPKNRKKFTARIATGDYDAVIIGHSQFEKIPMSIERQRAILEQQMDEIVDGISEIKRNRGDNFSIKQLEKTKKGIKLKLDKLNDQSRKDDVVTFEELGVDRVFIDEAHYYKNLYLYTKMRNVGGIAQTEAQKSSDLFMKCRYLDEITGSKGVIFATGTPISNSMVEMYTLQRYLQYGTLQRNGLQHFDSWASTFGETVTAIELAPEGTGYRAKTRFAKFYNLPELMCMFKEVADIQTADMLNLPVPEAVYHNVAVKPSEMQKEMVAELSERAEKVRNKMVDSSVDNMLKITNDGRKLALDQRLANEMLPDFEDSKINACVENIHRIWNETTPDKSAQLVFCDLSTPKGDGTFSVYNDIRDKLIERGIPKEELQFIHVADSEAKKKDLFNKVRKGDVRVLFGSTAKMGAGTNMQERLIALHDIDCPWRPSDLEQRSGRIIRQGNTNPKVEIFRYVTEQTFDAYLYQIVEGKQKFISQIMTSKSPVRSAEDIDETALSYAEIKMLATGNPHIKEKMDLDIQVAKLKMLKQNHLSERYSLEDKLIKTFPREIKSLEERIVGTLKDIATLANNTPKGEEKFLPMTIDGVIYTEKADAGQALIDRCKAMTKPDIIPVGEYRGFGVSLEFDTFAKEYRATLKGEISHKVSLGTDVHGNITRLDNLLEGMETRLDTAKNTLENTKTQMKNAEIEVKREFPQEPELKEKTARLDELNILLNMDKRENEVVDGDIENADEPAPKKQKDMER